MSDVVDSPGAGGSSSKPASGSEPVAPEPANAETVATELSKAREAGNDAYRRGDYNEAVDRYSQAIHLSKTDHTLFSNRSAAFLAMNQLRDALTDALRCVELAPDWTKGYARLGQALLKSKKLDTAKQAYERGLELDPDNAFLKEGLNEVLLAQGGAAPNSPEKSGQSFRSRTMRLVNPLGLGGRGMCYYILLVGSLCALAVYRRTVIPIQERLAAVPEAPTSMASMEKLAEAAKQVRQEKEAVAREKARRQSAKQDSSKRSPKGRQQEL